MNPALWGGVCALNLGSADFLARFSARGVGSLNAFFAVLLVSTTGLTIWAIAYPPSLVWDDSRLWLLCVNGVATTAMTLLLYEGLSRGPISVVAPIVSSHPALVVIFWFMLGARPGVLQWVAMAVIAAGVFLVSRFVADSDDTHDSRTGNLKATVLIASGASLAYAVLVIAGQAAVPVYGEFQTMWFGRMMSFAALLAIFVVRRNRPTIPLRWWPFLAIQGTLDVLGYLALFAGSHGEGSEIAAVTASTFGAVTVLLARFALRETVTGLQWLGIVMVFSGVVVITAVS